MPSDINKRFLDTVNEIQKTLLPIAGSGLFWAWGFAWALNESVLSPGAPTAENAYASSMIAYVITALVLFYRFTKGKTTHTKSGVLAFTAIVSIATLVEILVPYLPYGTGGSSVIMVLLGFVNGAGLLYLSIAWGARYTINGRRASITIVISFLVAFLINVLFELLPYPTSAILVVAFPALSTLIWYVDAAIRQEQTSEVWPSTSDSKGGSSGEILAGDASPTILPWRTISVLSIVMFLTNFFNSFDVPIDVGVRPLTISFLLATVLCLVYVIILSRSRVFSNIKGAYLLLIPTATFALLLVMLFDGRISGFSSGMLMGSAFLLHVVIWVQLAQTSVNEGLAPLVAFGVGGTFITSLQILGNLTGRVMQLLGFSTYDSISICALVSILVLTTSVVFLFYGDGEKRMQADSPEEDTVRNQDFEGAIERFAVRYSLSEREKEVFGYFARGRNIPYVAEKLFVTSGTIKSHSNHIFQKTCVASRQQLLDLFEFERSVDTMPLEERQA